MVAEKWREQILQPQPSFHVPFVNFGFNRFNVRSLVYGGGMRMGWAERGLENERWEREHGNLKWAFDVTNV